MDLGGWLRSLGLERYEAAFRENEIDETVMPSLTAKDLKDLGVSIVGHRRKLLVDQGPVQKNSHMAIVVAALLNSSPWQKTVFAIEPMTPKLAALRSSKYSRAIEIFFLGVCQ
jgi:hypothetical protein